jgi:hypothetical protein
MNQYFFDIPLSLLVSVVQQGFGKRVNEFFVFLEIVLQVLQQQAVVRDPFHIHFCIFRIVAFFRF